jgi:hypothetical protein
VQAKINAVLLALQDSFALRPACADYLPDDPEVEAWARQHAALEEKRDHLIATRDQLPDPERDWKEAGSYEGPLGLLARLEYAEANLLRQLGKRDSVEGGVISGVR